jgi:chromosome segregation ATPase
LDFVALALRGKKAGFDDVLKMVDALVGTLKDEQIEDDKKKAYCGQEMNKAGDKKTGLLRNIKDTESAIGKAKEDVVALGEAIKKLIVSIKDLDKAVAEATLQRKEEHEEYSSLMAETGTAKELLGFAKNRLNKYYNPKLHKAAPERQLSEEDRIVANNGGTLPPTEAPGGISGTNIGTATSFLQVEDDSELDSETEGFTGYKKAAQESSGVIALLNLLIADLDKQMTEAKVEEKHSQEDYEQAMKDAAAKRAADSKALAESEAERADLESDLEQLVSAKKSAKKELASTSNLIMALHGECDFLLKFFDVRKEARQGEVDSLTKARAVLSGADFSFLQVAATARHSRRYLRHS